MSSTDEQKQEPTDVVKDALQRMYELGKRHGKEETQLLAKPLPNPPQVEDTSLDDILAILDDHHCIVTDELGKSCAEQLLAWHTAKINRLIEEAEVKSLLKLRTLYDNLELSDTKDFEGNDIATWSGYKWFRNPISDRLEELTGFRSDNDIQQWLALSNNLSKGDGDVS